MQAWMPNFEPSAQHLKLAEKELSAQRHRGSHNTGKTGRRRVTEHMKGRAERRWRRKILIHACNLALQKSDRIAIRNESDLWEWLSKNRDKIAAHIARAVDGLMDDESTPKDHDMATEPLVMPEQLYRRRRRTENGQEEWHIFGDTTLFDLIPVASPSKPWVPIERQWNPEPSEDPFDWNYDAGDS